MSKVWLVQPPEVEGPYLLVGCPPGKYVLEMPGGVPDAFNSPGSVQTIDKRRVNDFLKVRAKVGTPFVFADRELWWKMGGPLPGPDPTNPPEASSNVGNSPTEARVKQLESQLSEARAALADALSRLQKVADIVAVKN